MMKYVAFLGAINVGKRRVKMPVLAEIFEGLGHDAVHTFIASGDVIFESRKRNQASLEDSASSALHEALGYEVSVFVRRAEDLVTVANTDLFKDEEDRGSAVNVGFMQYALDAVSARKLESVRTNEDFFKVVQSEFYWDCRTKIFRNRGSEICQRRNGLSFLTVPFEIFQRYENLSRNPVPTEVNGRIATGDFGGHYTTALYAANGYVGRFVDLRDPKHLIL